MYFKQFYLGCLAHASYLICSDAEAAVVDPQRDVEQYVAEAEAQGCRVKYVVETHLHADFVSGHKELAARTGAEIVFGARAGAAVAHRAVKDGDELRVGKVVLRVLETPGHTPEGISLVVVDTEVSDQPQKVLTGDTLFIGDVGRPDLAGARGYTSEMMAGMLYDSLHDKLLRLDDAVEVYPAHGAGSMCGRNMSKETSSTIGQQRRCNYALQPMARAEFVRLMTTDLPEQPAYFARDAEINRAGAPALTELPPPVALTPAEVERETAQGALVLDVRPAAEFGAGHVPGALNVGLAGQFALWAGSLIPLSTPVVLVAETEAQVGEARTRLARVGLEDVRGYLRGGVAAWREAGRAVAVVPQISVAELKELIETRTDVQVLDVRRAPEYAGGHVPRARHAPLAQLERQLDELSLDPARTLAVICAGGYRSSAATSILARRGFARLLNVTGGTSAWTGAGYETTVTSDELRRL
ncbi:MAG TPA: MBL fold metallo-hydrolase [Pyrinomonadaceae bacterium]|jgi:glyoxylase-like metal-dependent hydrolase (beta-lactamase superfamily II)/rhodanese-related sulfurtransferase